MPAARPSRWRRFLADTSFLREYLWKYRKLVAVGILALIVVDLAEGQVEHLDAELVRAHDRAVDGCVQRGRVAARREDSDSLHVSTVAFNLRNSNGTRGDPSRLPAKSQHRMMSSGGGINPIRARVGVGVLLS